MHYETQANIVFYSIAALATLVLLLGLIGMVHFWSLGKSKHLDAEIKVSKWIRSIVKASFLQTQILEYSFIAWLAHLMIFWGFISLLLLTTFHFVLNWLVPASLPFFRYFKDGSGQLLLAFWGDFWGLILLMGVLLALFRRYILRPKKLHTISDDSVAIWFLLLVTLSGFMCEAVRLAARPYSQDAVYSFAVNWLIPFLHQYNLTEAQVTISFWIHALVSFFFLAYIPFSKFRHIFASPLDYAFVTSSNQYTKEKWIEKK